MIIAGARSIPELHPGPRMWVISYLDLAIIAFTDLLQSPL